jgi:hypothetical protein
MALGADHLFPIFVWCTVHASIPDICTRIAWLRLFANARDTNSETGCAGLSVCLCEWPAPDRSAGIT